MVMPISDIENAVPSGNTEAGLSSFESSTLNKATLPRTDKLTYVGRACTVLLLLAVVVWTFRNWQFMLDPRVSITTDSSEARQDVLSQISPMSQASGTWTFSGVPWKLAVDSVADDQIETKLAGPATRKLYSESGKQSEGNLIQLLADLGVPSESIGGGREFKFAADGIRVLIRTIVKFDTERVRLARLAFRESGHWALFELVPESEPPSLAVPDSQHLMPLPVDSRQVCARRSPDGSLILEVASVDVTGDELIRDWQAADWTVHRRARPSPGESEILDCHRNGHLITVWGAPRSSDGGWQLFMLDAGMIQ
jgi:hypothetical protein